MPDAFPLIVARALTRLPLSRQSVTAVETKPLKAFSKHSRLFRYTVSYRGPKNQVKRAILRSNHWPAQAYRILNQLWRDGRVTVPQPLVYRSQDGLVVYRELDGLTLRSAPVTKAGLESVASLGNVLALVHQTKLSDLSAPSLNKERQLLRKKINLVRRLGLVGQIISAWEKPIVNWWAKHWSGQQFTVTHGDFQASNIIVERSGRAGLIDFSLSRRFFPAADVATWLIHFRAMTYGRLPEQSINYLERRFVSRYRRTASPSLWLKVERSLEAFRAAAVIDVAATSIKVYGTRDKNVRRLLDYLVQLIKIERIHDSSA